MEDNNQNADTTQVGDAQNVGTQANTNKDEGKAERTYTQAEYNALDKKLKEKYEKKYEGVDLAKYNAWVESQKTAEQKQAEKEAEYLKKDNRISDLEKENAILKGVTYRIKADAPLEDLCIIDKKEALKMIQKYDLRILEMAKKIKQQEVHSLNKRNQTKIR